MRTNNVTFTSLTEERPQSIWLTLATLPLRILSILSLVLWILVLLFVAGNVKWGLNSFVFFLLPAAYFFFSAYVTFRSPRKVVLLLTGIAANVPVTFIGSFAYSFSGPGFRKPLLGISVICGAFLLAWSIFLMSRLTVRAQVKRLKSFRTIARNADHHCLGSRFLDWHEHHA